MSSIISLVKATEDLAEKILVIPANTLVGQEGLIHMTEDELKNLIVSSGQYKTRNPQLESDEAYKQLITYPLLKCGDRFLYARRTSKGGEGRLHGMGLIGFGGHVRAEDIEGKPFDTWIEREVNEELEIESNIIRTKYMGLISDNTNAVGKVHAGVVFIIELDGYDVVGNDDTHEGFMWKTIDELNLIKGELEVWSSLIVDSIAR